MNKTTFHLLETSESQSLHVSRERALRSVAALVATYELDDESDRDRLAAELTNDDLAAVETALAVIGAEYSISVVEVEPEGDDLVGRMTVADLETLARTAAEVVGGGIYDDDDVLSTRQVAVATTAAALLSGEDDAEPAPGPTGAAEVVETFPVVEGLPLRLNYRPEAIREHFDGCDDKWARQVAAMSDAELLTVGFRALSEEPLYDAWHEGLVRALASLTDEDGASSF